MSIPVTQQPQGQVQYVGAPPQQPMYQPGYMPAQAQYAPMMQQPQGISQISQNQMSANTNVIFNQKHEKKRDWASGLCGCCDDVGTCLSVMCCPLCMECYMSSRMGEHWWMPLMVPMALLPLRTKLRNQHKIKGNIKKDCGAVVFFYPLTLCQLKREHDLISEIIAKKAIDANANVIGK